MERDETLLVSDLSRAVVAEIAPQELGTFEVMSRTYFQNPEQAVRKPAKDPLMGFEMGGAEVLFTPVVLAVMTEVMGYLVIQVKDTVKEQSAGVIVETIKEWFKKLRPADDSKKKPQKEPPPLTAEQLAQVRLIVVRKAKLLGLDEKIAKLLADAIVGGLATI